jgi:hypothetical protein
MNNLFTVKVHSMGAVSGHQASKTGDSQATPQSAGEINQDDYRMFVAQRRAESVPQASHTVSDWLANLPGEKS